MLIGESFSEKNLINNDSVDELYQKYNYLHQSEYDGIRGLIEEGFNNTDKKLKFIGEGVNGFVLCDPIDNTKVLKVGKENKHNIQAEFKMHNAIYNSLNFLKNDECYGIDTKIKIPEIFYKESDNYFQMEKVKGQTFKTKFYLESYGNKLEKLNYKSLELENMMDCEIEKILKDNGFTLLPDPNNTTSTYEEKQLETYYDDWWYEKYDIDESKKFEEVKKVIDLIGLGSEYIYDNIYDLDDDENPLDIFIEDRNAGNLMITQEGDVYLIDFGHEF